MKGKLAWTGGNMEAGITPFSTIAGAKEKRSDDVTETKFVKNLVLVGISRMKKIKKVHLLTISLPQIGGEMLR